MVSFLAERLLFPFALRYMKSLTFPFTIEELLLLPESTLGYALGMQMRQYKIEFIPGFESHDIKHLLTGYSIKVTGEIRLAWFELGNGIYSPTNFIVGIFSIFFAPDCWFYFGKDFKRGQKAKKLTGLNSVSFLIRNFEEVKQEIFRFSDNGH